MLDVGVGFPKSNLAHNEEHGIDTSPSHDTGPNEKSSG